SLYVFFFSSRRRHTRFSRDWSSDVCSSDLPQLSTFSLTNTFFWIILFSTIFSICLSFTRARHYENYGASKLGTVLLYMLIVTIRSEERRVGKECRERGARYDLERKYGLMVS